jgi:hypothetical protein
MPTDGAAIPRMTIERANAKANNRRKKIFFFRWPNVEKKLKSGFPQFAICV